MRGTWKGKILTKVVVIGGGFGGLSAAIELANKGFEVDLLTRKVS